jgi:dCTP diphosphatase
LPSDDSLRDLSERLAALLEQRNWSRFHTPKNLALALVGEVGELAAELQWLTDDEAIALDHRRQSQVRHELADILIYLLRLADVLDVDLVAAAHEKASLNTSRSWPDTDS